MKKSLIKKTTTISQINYCSLSLYLEHKICCAKKSFNFAHQIELQLIGKADKFGNTHKSCDVDINNFVLLC